MDNLQLSPAKLFYFITEMFKKGIIDEKEKITLKELVISDDPNVYNFLQHYERDQNEKELSDNLLSRIRYTEKRFYLRGDSKRGSLNKESLFFQNEQSGSSSPYHEGAHDEQSSPLGTYLMHRKKTVQRDLLIVSDSKHTIIIPQQIA